MQLIRRECFWLFALATGAPLATQAWAQGGPKLSQILRHDLENQDYTVQETVASIVEFPTGSAAPWHMHPSAQELLYVVDDALTVEIEGQGKMLLKEGEATIIAADLIHLARNESAVAISRALVVHSRAAKEKPLTVVKT